MTAPSGKTFFLNPKEYSEEELVAAARDACLHDTVMAFPRGYDTLVGERGLILSGGQKQRVALARALIRKAPILILDDPISQVDACTGNAIIEAVRRKTGTILMASHRLSALASADRIITLEGGEITEAGTHQTLLARPGYYARAYRMQEMEEALHAG